MQDYSKIRRGFTNTTKNLISHDIASYIPFLLLSKSKKHDFSIHRLQGIVANMSRIPSFRRRFNNLVKALYSEAVEIGAVGRKGNSKSEVTNSRLAGGEETQNNRVERTHEVDRPTDGDEIV